MKRESSPSPSSPFSLLLQSGSDVEETSVTGWEKARQNLILKSSVQGSNQIAFSIFKKCCSSTEGSFLHLSVVMTACSMVLAIGLMPLLLYLYLGGLYDLEGKVPYKGIITSLVLMLIPCAIGIILNEKKPQYTGVITKVRSIPC